MKGMVVIKVSGFEECDKKLTLKEEKSGLLNVSNLIFLTSGMSHPK